MSVESLPTPPRSPPQNPVSLLLDRYLLALPKTPPSPQSPLPHPASQSHPSQAARIAASTKIANVYFAETDAQLREALRDADTFQELYIVANTRADRLEDECRQLRDAVQRLHRAHMADAKFNAAVIKDQAAEIDCLKERLQENDDRDSDAEYESFEQWERRGEWHKEWTRLSQSNLRGLPQPQCFSETTNKTGDTDASDTSTLPSDST